MPPLYQLMPAFAALRAAGLFSFHGVDIARFRHIISSLLPDAISLSALMFRLIIAISWIRFFMLRYGYYASSLLFAGATPPDMLLTRCYATRHFTPPLRLLLPPLSLPRRLMPMPALLSRFTPCLAITLLLLIRDISRRYAFFMPLFA